MASCKHCDADLPRDSRYCPQCGRAVESGQTKVMELPADETGEVPVEEAHSERRIYGVPPATLTLLLAAGALAFAILLIARGHWPYGLILMGVSLLLVIVFLEAVKREPENAVARSTAGAFDTVRAHAGLAVGSVATRGRAAGRLLALRRELQQLGSRRDRFLFELGEAVYRGDEQATKTAHEQVKELDELAARTGAEMEALVAQTQDRLQRRKLEVQATEIVEEPREPGTERH